MFTKMVIKLLLLQSFGKLIQNKIQENRIVIKICFKPGVVTDIFNPSNWYHCEVRANPPRIFLLMCESLLCTFQTINSSDWTHRQKNSYSQKRRLHIQQVPCCDMWQQSQFHLEVTIKQTTVLVTRLGFPVKREGANMMAEQVKTLAMHARSVAKSQNPSRKERTSKSSPLTPTTCSQWRIQALMHTHTQIKFMENPVNFL